MNYYILQILQQYCLDICKSSMTTFSHPELIGHGRLWVVGLLTKLSYACYNDCPTHKAEQNLNNYFQVEKSIDGIFVGIYKL